MSDLLTPSIKNPDAADLAVRLTGIRTRSPFKSNRDTQERNAEAQFVNARRLEEHAKERLEAHPHFCGRSQWIRTRFSGGCLTLQGKLPTFFLKQLAQEALRELDGVDHINNQITVASPQGSLTGMSRSIPASWR